MAAQVVALVQSSGLVSENAPSSRNSCPMKIIGMPGAVMTMAAPRVERRRAIRSPGLLGEIIDGMRWLPLATTSWSSV